MPNTFTQGYLELSLSWLVGCCATPLDCCEEGLLDAAVGWWDEKDWLPDWPAIGSPIPSMNVFSIAPNGVFATFLGRSRIYEGTALPVRNWATSFENVLQLWSNKWYFSGLWKRNKELTANEPNKEHSISLLNEESEQEQFLCEEFLLRNTFTQLHSYGPDRNGVRSTRI